MSHVGNERDWKIMFEKFTNETDASEKLNLMRSLSAVRNVAILRRYLLVASSQILNSGAIHNYKFSSFIEVAMNENYIRAQDALNCLASISENPIGTSMVWDWVREFWDLLVQKYTLNDRSLGKLIPSITKSFATETKLNEMKAFFKQNPQSGAGKADRIRALETVAGNIKWLKKHANKMDSWLDENPPLN